MTPLLLALSLLAAPARAGASMPAVGAPAPDFTLQSQEGKPVSLAAQRGKWVVLYFYPKDFTGGCTVEARGFQKDLPEYERRGAVILGVSTQDPGSHKSFCEKEGLAFTLLADPGHAVSDAYGSTMNLGVAKLSARRTFLVAPDGTIARVFAKVSPSKHSAEVLAALDENLAAAARQPASRPDDVRGDVP